MPKNFLVIVLLALLAPVPVMAQLSGNALLQEILQATRLPTVTRESRELGIPERDLRTIFAAAHEHQLPAGSLAELLSEENDSIRRHGPVDNFGAFVQEKLAAGLRGRELAAAIHAEHAARGMGKGHSMGTGKPGVHPGSSGSAGKPGSADEHDDKSDSPGKSGQSGKKGGTR